MATEITISGGVVGTHWWPSDVQWVKPVRRTIDREDRISLYDEVSAMLDDGDSASACRLTGDTDIIVTRVRAGHSVVRRSRAYLASSFPSLRELIDESVHSTDGDEPME